MALRIGAYAIVPDAGAKNEDAKGNLAPHSFFLSALLSADKALHQPSAPPAAHRHKHRCGLRGTGEQDADDFVKHSEHLGISTGRGAANGGRYAWIVGRQANSQRIEPRRHGAYSAEIPKDPTMTHTTAICALSITMLAATTVQDSFTYPVHDMKRPQPAAVTAGAMQGATAPSDAVVLFDGNSPDRLTTGGKECAWKVEGGELVVTPGAGDVSSRDSFGDCQMHLEFMVPADRKCDGQHGCNSGVFFMNQYEVQVLNSHDNTTYADGMAGSCYGQHPPMVNACRPKGEWNVYDLVFRAPRFDAEGKLVTPAFITLMMNGVLVQDHVALLGSTAHAARAKYSAHPSQLPIRLQDHGDPIHFRNIWVRRLPEPQRAQ